MHEHNFAAMVNELMSEMALSACKVCFDQELDQEQIDKVNKIRNNLIAAFKEAKGEQMDMTEGT